MTLTNDAKAVVALTTRLGHRSRPSLTAKKWHQIANALRDSGRRPEDVFDDSFDPSELGGVDSDLVTKLEALLGDAASATLEVDELSRRGIWTLTIVDETYPQSLIDRLGDRTPPVLFGAGNQDLLREEGIGMVGSRDVDEKGAGVAKEVAERAVALGYPVVSGGARGIDQLAMNAAYMVGGSVIGVLADSLLARIRKPDVLEALDSGNTCLIAQQVPSAGFTAGSAMGRNKLVYALSAATVIVASASDSGGTWSGAVEAIKADNGIVIVWRGDGQGPGNEGLEERGAAPMTMVSQLEGLLQSRNEPLGQMKLNVP